MSWVRTSVWHERKAEAFPDPRGPDVFLVWPWEQRQPLAPIPAARCWVSCSSWWFGPDPCGSVSWMVPVRAAALHPSSVYLSWPVVSKQRGVKYGKPGRQLWKKSGDWWELSFRAHWENSHPIGAGIDRLKSLVFSMSQSSSLLCSLGAPTERKLQSFLMVHLRPSFQKQAACLWRTSDPQIVFYSLPHFSPCYLCLLSTLSSH